MPAKLYEYNGLMMTLKQLEEYSEASANTIKQRIYLYGLSVKDAVENPLKGKHRKVLHPDGYIYSCGKRTDRGREHVLVAERALGKKLPKGAVVHHIDENRSNNHPSNLCIFPSRAYHALIHARMNALAVSGNANHRKCVYCKTYDDIKNLVINSGNRSVHHRLCHNKYHAELKAKKMSSNKSTKAA